MNASQTLSFADKAAITGVGETAFVKGTERTAVDMMLEASRRAIADAGLKPSDIDGMVPPPIYTTSEEMAANLGIDVLRYAATVHMGGASPTTALQNAAMAIASGLCDHVLVTLGWNGYSALRPKPGAPPTRAMNMNTLTNTIQGYYIPYGVFLPVQMYAWLATRHSKLYGVGADAMAAVALACRRHAQLNPRAFTYGRELDAETYHSARWMGIGEVFDRGCARRRDIEDAGIGQRMLQAKASAALLGRGAVAAFALAAMVTVRWSRSDERRTMSCSTSAQRSPHSSSSKSSSPRMASACSSMSFCARRLVSGVAASSAARTSADDSEIRSRAPSSLQ